MLSGLIRWSRFDWLTLIEIGFDKNRSNVFSRKDVFTHMAFVERYHGVLRTSQLLNSFQNEKAETVKSATKIFI